ncbi:response regulator transcription factor [Luteolibacter sp. LG18]|uniref:response regulator transcription factor n=1 Tax=Luteolibacter sp. LG18 TaxID=2819286 RepID=UPI002B2FA91C|nr:DNA-binding response regulator [Luteolibacter sp. LG18]
MNIRVAVVEDDAVTRESLVALINRAPDMTCIASWASAEAAIAELPKQVPDILLTDINLPGASGITCVATLKAAHPGMQVIMLTTYDDTDSIFDSLRSGASGYLLKRSAATELLPAIREVAIDGGSPMSAHIARKVVTYFHPERRATPEMQSLTPREQEILARLAKGLLYKEIADQLGISVSTVRAHLHAVYGKLHVQSRTEAVVKYLQG